MDINYPSCNDDSSIIEFVNSFDPSNLIEFADIPYLSIEDHNFDFNDLINVDFSSETLQSYEITEFYYETNERSTSVGIESEESSIYDSNVSSPESQDYGNYNYLPLPCVNFDHDKLNDKKSQKKNHTVFHENDKRKAKGKGRPQKDISDLQKRLEHVNDHYNRRVIKNNIASRKYRHNISKKRCKLEKIEMKLLEKNRKLREKTQKNENNILQLKNYCMKNEIIIPNFVIP